MADGSEGQPRTSFQQPTGWSLSPKSRTRGKTTPGNLLGISEQRNQFPLVTDDAPVSPGTAAPQGDSSNNYFDSSPSPRPAAIRINGPRDESPADSPYSQSTLNAVAPWEALPNNVTLPPFANNGSPFGTYSDAWSGDNRPGTSRTQTSESLSCQTQDAAGHKRSISDRLRPGHLRHNSGVQKQNERAPLTRKKSSTGSGGLRSRGHVGKDAAATPNRPKTPQASREVAPWDYQEPGQDYRYASSQPALPPPPLPEFVRTDTTASELASGSRKGMFGHHRQRNSRDENRGLRSQNSTADLTSDRSRLATKQSRTNLLPFSRRQTDSLRPNIGAPVDAPPRLEGRATSPVGSIRSAFQASQLDGTPGSSRKPGLLGRIGKKLHIGDSSANDDQDGSPPQQPYQQQFQPTSSPAYTSSPASTSQQGLHEVRHLGPGDSASSRQDSMVAIPALARKDSALPKKESTKRGLFKHRTGSSRRTGTSDSVSARGGDKMSKLPGDTSFELDLNLGDMKGIVDEQGQHSDYVIVHGPGVSYFDPQTPGPQWGGDTPMGGAATWDAPDSWAVKRLDDAPPDKQDTIDEEPAEEEFAYNNATFCIRVFRVDGTFSTLALPLGSSVSEILKVLGKKSFLQDDLNNYQIILRKGDLQRELAPTERPIFMQKKLLERAGYNSTDRLDQEGQDDNSYLCRFTFVPVKVSGYYSLDKESAFEFERMNKFSNIDLSGRSLVTIPIVLHKKSPDIVSLNLSRNLALDVPRDFLTNCSHLKEIRYTGNEARSVPPSFSLAPGLQVLDVSHNQIESLENADLGRIPTLCSLKVANNKLSSLPFYFTQFRHLRSLNLSSNNFKSLPSFFGELRGLVDLDISFNSLEAWPPVEELVSLERFWATNNKLNGAVPQEYINLRNLKDIDVRFNAIANIDVVTRLPNVEQILIAHNAIARFEGYFPRLRLLQIDHNPITRFTITAPMPTLTTLNLASNKLNEVESDLYEKIPNLAKLHLDKNFISNLAIDIGRLSHLEVLTIAKNPLMTFPSTIGCLQELRKIDARECNIKRLPPEIWFCSKLEELNLAWNVLDNFPKLAATTQPPVVDPVNAKSGASIQSGTANAQNSDEVSNGDERRPSQASATTLNYTSSPAASVRKNSVMSGNSTTTTINGRKPSMPSRQATDLSSSQHKDSGPNSRLAGTFALSLRSLCLASNRLRDEVFDSIMLLGELKSLNLSYNDLDDIPSGVMRKWPNLQELYLSGNELSTLPTEDLESVSGMKALYLNGNKFQTLPAELAKISRLLALDVSCNTLKYNVANWPYDWNWVWNPYLRYLNLSGNRRLEIKPQPFHSAATAGGPQGESLTSFNSLQSLRVLGLIDVTLTIPHVPDETDDRRVRTTGSILGGLRYGMADTLGKQEHLSILDLMIPKFRGHDSEYLVGMFDGQASQSGGSRVARFLQENFKYYFTQQLAELTEGETPQDALRRTFLTLNKDLITFTTSNFDATTLRLKQTPIKHAGSAHALNPDDRTVGGVATVLFIQDMQLYVANVGNAEAMLMPSDGTPKMLTFKHEPANTTERERIREAGGFVSRYGKLNDSLEVSRAFGYAQHVPAVMAAPHIIHVPIGDQDELVLIASKEFWDYVTPNFAIDLARKEREDPMHAAQKLRDSAIAFGASSKIMVMVIGVNELKRSSSTRRTLIMPSRDEVVYSRPRGRNRDQGPDDTRLAMLDREVDAPTGDVALVFTDIKSSTVLWEKCPVAMRSAIRIHNDLMRRQLRIIGGYEVKTEGDAFMISFPTPTSALLWCFSIQMHLLKQEWPTEILDSAIGQEMQDDDGNTIYRGLSVRMGIHWGNPVCEPDPITRRMDYFGPMVNKAARIQSVADGGEITCSADFIAEIQRYWEMYADTGEGRTTRTESTGSEDTVFDDSFGQSIRKDLRALSTQGFEVKEMGERKLKGIENPEVLFQVYPHDLAGRQTLADKRKLEAPEPPVDADAHPGVMEANTKLNIEAQNLWDIWMLSLRLEMLCSAMEDTSGGKLRSPETAIMERVRNQGGEVTDKVLVQFMEHLVCRIETCVNTLALRNIMNPFNEASNLLDMGCPATDLFAQLVEDLKELKKYREEKARQVASR